MRRFFIDAAQAAKAEKDGIVEITGKDVRHIVNVLRMRTGDCILLSASDGREFEARITGCGEDLVSADVLNVRLNATEPRVPVTLLQGVPKGDKMELIIQKCVELGVTSIVPVMTEHTVVRLSEAEAEKKRARWQKISEEAAKQCGRGIIPQIGAVTGFEKALRERPEAELKLFAYENEEDITLKHRLEQEGASFEGQLSLLIGPEGGFSLSEAETARKYGFVPVSLGKRILRTETAGIAALSGIRFYFED